ncbi:MAG TPA: hypothetical protein VG297_17540, partial [Bryobacteraceae bacterium]|nr:hypothetical protein [Bryobacteraceae bacterium]
VNYAATDFGDYFSATGAVAGSTHYQSAFFEPMILNYMNSGSQGQLSMDDPKWAAYANWEMSIQTPPEPRFGNLRKGYSNGDGNTEADVRTGMLGTAMHATNPALASNLMWAWQQSNAPNRLTEDSQFVTTLAAIDPSIPAVAPQLASTNIPGYHSVERHNFGTPQETALWFIDGGFYSTGGHRHYDDGQVSIYALSAPLAIDWNANLYSPETPGRFMHNSIVYDSELAPRNWSDDQPDPALVSSLFQNPTNTEFAAFQMSTTATGTFLSRDGTTTWTRTVRTLNFNPSYPIIYVNDTFAGSGAGTGKTLTWNLMATGAVQTPAGAVTPIIRFSAGCQSPAGALPSNGLVNPVPQGLGHFRFTGATWPAHATQGIDWDLYTVSNNATGQFLIGNWGHGCHSTGESAEYQQINGAPFAETQHILRVHGNGGFTTVMLPNRKGEARANTVTQQACGTEVTQGSEITCFNASAASYAKGGTRLLAVFDSSTQTDFGLTVTGGPQEVIVESSQIIWTLGGVQAGPRSITLPGIWYPSPAQGVTRTGNTWTYNYAGLPSPQQGADTVAAQPVPVTITFSQVPVP